MMIYKWCSDYQQECKLCVPVVNTEYWLKGMKPVNLKRNKLVAFS